MERAAGVLKGEVAAFNGVAEKAGAAAVIVK